MLGAIGLARAAVALWRRRQPIFAQLTATPVAAASAGVIGLNVAVASVYTAAPEIQFDALYGKATLPMLWAGTGRIGSLAWHSQLNNIGWTALPATWGQLLGAPAVGRYLQLIAFVVLPVALWALARRKGALGPLAAVAVAVTPMLFWQATTAYDDLRIALAALGCSVAMLIALQPQFTGSGRATGLAIGLMAGTLVSVKIHEVVPAGALVLAWALSSGGRRLAGSQVAGRRVDDSQAAWRHVVARQVAVRLTWALAGALVTASVPFVLRFIDTGNPVFPYYNNIFHSRTGRRRTISRASRGSPRPGRSVPHERCGTRWSTAGS